MGISAWQLCSWPPYPWRIPDDAAQWPAFVHAQTSVREKSPGDELRQGESVWVATVGSMVIGLGWEWVELRRGVFMIKDPNYVTTNVQFLSDALAAQDELDGIVSANRLAHALPWQAEVARVLGVPSAVQALSQLKLRGRSPNLRRTDPLRRRANHWPEAA